MPENNKDIELDLSQFDLPTLRLIDKALRPSEFDLFWKKAKTGDEWLICQSEFNSWCSSLEDIYLRCNGNEIVRWNVNRKEKRLGVHVFDVWGAESQGLYFNDGLEAFFIDQNGEKMSLGKHRFNNVVASPDGLYLCYGIKTKEIFLLDQNGQKKSLGKYTFNGYGFAAANGGVYLHCQDEFVFVDQNRKMTSLGKHDVDGWNGCFKGICFSHENEIFILYHDGQKKSLGIHQYHDRKPSFDGVYFRLDNDFYFQSYQGGKVFLGNHDCNYWKPALHGIYLEYDDRISLIVNKEQETLKNCNIKPRF